MSKSMGGGREPTPNGDRKGGEAQSIGAQDRTEGGHRLAASDGRKGDVGCVKAALALESIIAGVRGLERTGSLRLPMRLKLLAEFRDEALAVVAAHTARGAGRSRPALQRTDPIVPLVRDAFGVLLDAYQSCAGALLGQDSADFPPGGVDLYLLQVAVERIRWERFALGPAHGRLWQWANDALRRSGAAADGVLQASTRSVSVNSPNPVAWEYLRLVAHFSVGYERLNPELLAVVGALVEALLPDLQLTTSAGGGCVCAVDLDSGMPPVRAHGVRRGSGDVRFLCCEQAKARLQSFDNELERGAEPTLLQGLGECDGGLVAAGAAHLMRHWCAELPVRQHRRHPIDGDLSAVRGLDDVRLVLAGRVWAGKGFVARFTDVSRGGVGAIASAESIGEPVVGELIALRAAPEGVWHLGVVRRLWRERRDIIRLGVQTLSIHPRIGRADDGCSRADVLVCDQLCRADVVRIVVPAGCLAFGAPLFLSSDGTLHKLRPLSTESLGDALEVWSYEVL